MEIPNMADNSIKYRGCPTARLTATAGSIECNEEVSFSTPEMSGSVDKTGRVPTETSLVRVEQQPIHAPFEIQSPETTTTVWKVETFDDPELDQILKDHYYYKICQKIFNDIVTLCLANRAFGTFTFIRGKNLLNYDDFIECIQLHEKHLTRKMHAIFISNQICSRNFKYAKHFMHNLDFTVKNATALNLAKIPLQINMEAIYNYSVEGEIRIYENMNPFTFDYDINNCTHEFLPKTCLLEHKNFISIVKSDWLYKRCFEESYVFTQKLPKNLWLTIMAHEQRFVVIKSHRKCEMIARKYCQWLHDVGMLGSGNSKGDGPFWNSVRAIASDIANPVVTTGSSFLMRVAGVLLAHTVWTYYFTWHRLELKETFGEVVGWIHDVGRLGSGNSVGDGPTSVDRRIDRFWILDIMTLLGDNLNKIIPHVGLIRNRWKEILCILALEIITRITKGGVAAKYLRIPRIIIATMLALSTNFYESINNFMKLSKNNLDISVLKPRTKIDVFLMFNKYFFVRNKKDFQVPVLDAENILMVVAALVAALANPFYNSFILETFISTALIYVLRHYNILTTTSTRIKGRKLTQIYLKNFLKLPVEHDGSQSFITYDYNYYSCVQTGKNSYIVPRDKYTYTEYKEGYSQTREIPSYFYSRDLTPQVLSVNNNLLQIRWFLKNRPMIIPFADHRTSVMEADNTNFNLWSSRANYNFDLLKVNVEILDNKLRKQNISTQISLNILFALKNHMVTYASNGSDYEVALKTKLASYLNAAPNCYQELLTSELWPIYTEIFDINTIRVRITPNYYITDSVPLSQYFIPDPPPPPPVTVTNLPDPQTNPLDIVEQPENTEVPIAEIKLENTKSEVQPLPKDVKQIIKETQLSDQEMSNIGEFEIFDRVVRDNIFVNPDNDYAVTMDQALSDGEFIPTQTFVRVARKHTPQRYISFRQYNSNYVIIENSHAPKDAIIDACFWTPFNYILETQRVYAIFNTKTRTYATTVFVARNLCAFSGIEFLVTTENDPLPATFKNDVTCVYKPGHFYFIVANKFLDRRTGSGYFCEAKIEPRETPNLTKIGYIPSEVCNHTDKPAFQRIGPISQYKPMVNENCYSCFVMGLEQRTYRNTIDKTKTQQVLFAEETDRFSRFIIDNLPDYLDSNDFRVWKARMLLNQTTMKKNLIKRDLSRLSRDENVVSTKTECFVKKEIDTTDNKNKERVINNPTSIAASTSTDVRAFDKSLVCMFNENLQDERSVFGGVRYVHTRGLDPVELGKLFEQSLDLCSKYPIVFINGDDSLFFIHDGDRPILYEMDITCFENSLTNAKIDLENEAIINIAKNLINREVTIDQLEQGLRLAKKYIIKFRTGPDNRAKFKGTSHDFVVEQLRSSGEPKTSSANSFQNMLLCSLVIDKIRQQTSTDQIISQTKALGYDITLLKHVDYHTASYCSGYFWPAFIDNKECFVYGPKIERALFRNSYSTVLEDPDAVRQSYYLCLHRDWNHIPILRNLIATYNTGVKPEKKTLMNFRHKVKVKQKPKFNPKSYHTAAMILKLPESVIMVLDKQISEWKTRGSVAHFIVLQDQSDRNSKYSPRGGSSQLAEQVIMKMPPKNTNTNSKVSKNKRKKLARAALVEAVAAPVKRPRPPKQLGKSPESEVAIREAKLLAKARSKNVRKIADTILEPEINDPISFPTKHMTRVARTKIVKAYQLNVSPYVTSFGITPTLNNLEHENICYIDATGPERKFLSTTATQISLDPFDDKNVSYKTPMYYSNTSGGSPTTLAYVDTFISTLSNFKMNSSGFANLKNDNTPVPWNWPIYDAYDRAAVLPLDKGAFTITGTSMSTVAFAILQVSGIYPPDLQVDVQVTLQGSGAKRSWEFTNPAKLEQVGNSGSLGTFEKLEIFLKSETGGIFQGDITFGITTGSISTVIFPAYSHVLDVLPDTDILNLSYVENVAITAKSLRVTNTTNPLDVQGSFSIGRYSPYIPLGDPSGVNYVQKINALPARKTGMAAKSGAYTYLLPDAQPYEMFGKNNRFSNRGANIIVLGGCKPTTSLVATVATHYQYTTFSQVANTDQTISNYFWMGSLVGALLSSEVGSENPNHSQYAANILRKIAEVATGAALESINGVVDVINPAVGTGARLVRHGVRIGANGLADLLD